MKYEPRCQYCQSPQVFEIDKDHFAKKAQPAALTNESIQQLLDAHFERTKSLQSSIDKRDAQESSGAELKSLQAQLVDKDRLIASLQAQVGGAVQQVPSSRSRLLQPQEQLQQQLTSIANMGAAPAKAVVDNRPTALSRGERERERERKREKSL